MGQGGSSGAAPDRWGGMCVALFCESDAAVVAAHLRHIRLLSLTEGTIYARARALHRMARFLPGPLTAATAGDLLAWRAALTVTDETVVHYVSHAREFYKWLVAEGLRGDDPAARLPVPKIPRRLPRPISDEDLAYAVASAPPRIRPWLILAAWCGLRAKEIALLRWECVLDTASPPVLLVAADATKGIRERVVPLHEFAAGELASLPGRRVGFVFRRYDGRPGPNAPWLVSQLANKHLHASGSTATLHALRHWFGTGTYHECRDLRVVQELMGHAQPSTTAGYAAFDSPAAAEAVAALPVPSALRPAGKRRRRARLACEHISGLLWRPVGG
jgi:integrase/recombinase XerC